MIYRSSFSLSYPQIQTSMCFGVCTIFVGTICPQRVIQKSGKSIALTGVYAFNPIFISVWGIFRNNLVILYSKCMKLQYILTFLDHTILKLEIKHQSQQNNLMSFIWQSLKVSSYNLVKLFQRFILWTLLSFL